MMITTGSRIHAMATQALEQCNIVAARAGVDIDDQQRHILFLEQYLACDLRLTGNQDIDQRRVQHGSEGVFIIMAGFVQQYVEPGRGALISV